MSKSFPELILLWLLPAGSSWASVLPGGGAHVCAVSREKGAPHGGTPEEGNRGHVFVASRDNNATWRAVRCTIALLTLGFPFQKSRLARPQK